jgi:hypothetical protein
MQARHRFGACDITESAAIVNAGTVVVLVLINAYLSDRFEWRRDRPGERRTVCRMADPAPFRPEWGVVVLKNLWVCVCTAVA